MRIRPHLPQVYGRNGVAEALIPFRRIDTLGTSAYARSADGV